MTAKRPVCQIRAEPGARVACRAAATAAGRRSALGEAELVQLAHLRNRIGFGVQDRVAGGPSDEPIEVRRDERDPRRDPVPCRPVPRERERSRWAIDSRVLAPRTSILAPAEDRPTSRGPSPGGADRVGPASGRRHRSRRPPGPRACARRRCGPVRGADGGERRRAAGADAGGGLGLRRAGDEAPSPNHHRGAEDGTLASLSRTISGSGSVLPMMSLIDHSIPVEEHKEFHVRHEPPARRLSTAAPSHRLLRRH